jgi:hypothetical protein
VNKTLVEVARGHHQECAVFAFSGSASVSANAVCAAEWTSIRRATDSSERARIRTRAGAWPVTSAHASRRVAGHVRRDHRCLPQTTESGRAPPTCHAENPLGEQQHAGEREAARAVQRLAQFGRQRWQRERREVTAV